jgi:uncharacterized damage-inducible protein DinB
VTKSLLEDAFAHHVWATLRLIDTCLELSAEQLGTAVAGTYGSILDTARHLVGADAWYLSTMTRDRDVLIEEDEMSLAELRVAMEANSEAWSVVLAADLDPDTVVLEVDDDDGFEQQATIGIRLAQVIHHGTDHRSQICTALTSLGVEPPGIDVWDYGTQVGRVVEVSPGS